MKERQYDADWPRVMAMLASYVFHCTRSFDREGWHLKNAEQNWVLFVLGRGLIWTCVIGLFPAFWRGFLVRAAIQDRWGLPL